MLRLIECTTQEDLRHIIAAGNIAILRKGYFIVEGSATVRATGSATVTAWGSSSVTATGSATVEARDSSTVRATGSATVEARDSSSVTTSGSATVEAWDSATVTAIARAVVRVLSATVKVHASGWATVILYAAAQVTAEASATVIDRIIRTVQDWVIAYGAGERDGKLVLFKWVRADGCSSHGFAYPECQTVEAPDWNPREDLECGCGLHACATLRDAEDYKKSEGRLAVELLVDPSDCRVPQLTDGMPDKIRFRRAFVVRVWDPTKEDA